MPTTNETMRAELAELFQRCDADSNGRIDIDEFERLLRRLGEDRGQAHLTAQFVAIDTDGDGGIDFDEFVAWWLRA